MKKVRSKLRPAEIGVIKTFSLSPNDEIGEIAVESFGCTYYYDNLRELCEKWEDYEEPKKYWTVECGVATEYTEGDEKYDRAFEAVGLKFDTKEECERAIEKLKAWKRLEDKGFFFDGRTTVHDNTVKIRARVGVPFLTDELTNDLDLLFGGEE